MDIEFRKAGKADLDELAEMYRLAVRAMNAAGIIQWDETYPTREHIERDINEDCLYVVTCDGLIAGAISWNYEVDDEHDTDKWSIPGEWRALHRLAVHPDYRGCGIGKETMHGIERVLRKEGIKALRFDTVSSNTPAMRLYKSQGWREVDRQPWIDGDIVYFEKAIS